MSETQLLLPAGLGGIDGQEPDQRVGMLRHIVGHITVVDPHAAQAGFAAEDDGPHIGRALGAVFVIANRQVEFDPGPRPAFRLQTEVVAEMLRVSPGMGMNVDNHG